MKHFITLAIAGAMAATAGAQAFEGTNFLDNWSIGIYGGGVAGTTHSLTDNARGVAGLELTKKITPVFGLSLSSMAGFNTTGSHTAIDNASTMLLGRINFSNWFWGYAGTLSTAHPRTFDVEGIVGIGFNHYFGKARKYAVTQENNTMASKFGLSFNFNLGTQKAWTLSLRPAIVYDLEGGKRLTSSQYNVNNSVLELTAGIAYNFKSSNGKHHFTYVRPYDAAGIDGLNAKINDLRAAINAKDKEIQNKDSEIRRLQQDLNDCRSQKPIVERIVNTRQTMESVVTFRQGKATVDASQLPNVERIATYLRNHPTARVIIKGYASPEGSAEVNAKIAQTRAEAVRNILINKYRIDSSRISAYGQGVGNMFSEPDWNRVSICTLDEGE